MFSDTNAVCDKIVELCDQLNDEHIIDRIMKDILRVYKICNGWDKLWFDSSHVKQALQYAREFATLYKQNETEAYAMYQENIGGGVLHQATNCQNYEFRLLSDSVGLLTRIYQGRIEECDSKCSDCLYPFCNTTICLECGMRYDMRTEHTCMLKCLICKNYHGNDSECQFGFQGFCGYCERRFVSHHDCESRLEAQAELMAKYSILVGKTVNYKGKDLTISNITLSEKNHAGVFFEGEPEDDYICYKQLDKFQEQLSLN